MNNNHGVLNLILGCLILFFFLFVICPLFLFIWGHDPKDSGSAVIQLSNGNVASVVEPATWILLGWALVAFLLWRVVRRNVSPNQGRGKR
jgi:hypothetical protein